MKIEDINYKLPTEQISSKDFDKEKWLHDNPIDYFKMFYVLFNTTNNAPENIPRDIAMRFAFEALFFVLRLYVPNVLYKFYSLSEDEQLNEKKFTTLQNKQIYMSDIKDFNDPFDGKAFFYDSDKLASINSLSPHEGEIIDDFTRFIKGTALTKNGESSMPMWAHYSNNHQGFCASYDMTDPINIALCANTFPIQYTNHRLDITSFMKEYAGEIIKQILQGKKDIIINDSSIVYIASYMYNVKHTSWQYENEFRCTMGATAKGMPYVDAMPKAIYIGMNCNEDNRKRLIAISKQLSIPVFQMKFYDLSERYTLEATPL